MNCVKVMQDNISPSLSFFEAASICVSWWATLRWPVLLSALYAAQRRLYGLINKPEFCGTLNSRQVLTNLLVSEYVEACYTSVCVINMR